ncbi:MAG: hypothetical protein ACE5IR_06240 [bacterium]
MPQDSHQKLLPGFGKKETLSRFVLGKSSPETSFGRTKLKYKKNLEKTLVGSLVLVIVVFRFTADFNKSPDLSLQESVVLEFLDLPEIPPLVEDKPKMKMENVVELPPIEEEVVETEPIIKEEIDEMLGENEEQVELSLDSDDIGTYLVSNSQLGTITGPQLSLRKRRASRVAKMSLRRGSHYSGSENGSSIDIGSTRRFERNLDSNESFELKTSLAKPKPVKQQRLEKKNELSLGISGQEGKVLSFAASTMGTEHYKLWNKINSELDRLNKGRYGAIPDKIKRNRGGFLIHLSYSDGVRHEIHWRNNGNVWIKIFGDSKKSALQELQRVWSSLLELTLN